MHSSSITAAANRLLLAAQTATPCSPVRELIGDTDVAAAYAVQQINVQHALSNGATLNGYKVGLTSAAVQLQLGVDQPDFGVLFAHTEILNGGSVNYSELMQPKAEAEIAFVLGSDLSVDKEPSLDEFTAAVSHCCAAIEVVGSRVLDWNIRITDTVADNASASHYVLGLQQVPLALLDLVGCQMQLHKNGALVSSGTGAACMGNPLTAAHWLAKTLWQLGTPLREGQVVLSGALGPMVSVAPGDGFKAIIEGLGSVSFTCV